MKFIELNKTYLPAYLSLLSQLSNIGNSANYEEYFDNVYWCNRNRQRTYLLIGDELIGCGTIVIIPRFSHSLSASARIEDVVVNDGFRGLGYGRKIIDYLVDYAKDLDCYKITLSCEQKNEEFYKKCGFSTVGLEMRQ